MDMSKFADQKVLSASHGGDGVHTRLQAQDVTIGYDKRVISESLSVDIPDGAFTVIVGPNACGKSTLLRALSRLLAPTKGSVLLTVRRSVLIRPKRWRAGSVSCRSHPSRPTASGSPTSSPVDVIPTRS